MTDRTLSIYGGILSFTEAEHAYQWEGKFVPGVTSILSLLNKPALIQWAANMAVAYIEENMVTTEDDWPGIFKDAKTAHRKASKSAADIGSEVHAFAERALTEQRVTMPTDPQARKGAEAFLGWLHAHNIEPLSCERMVMSKRWYYAGTCDFVGRVDNTNCILDFKTSSGLYPEMILQLAAYAIAVEEELGNDARFDDGWIIRLDKKTGKCEPYHIPLKDGYRDAFLRVREAHEALNKLDGDLDGLREQIKAA